MEGAVTEGAVTEGAVKTGAVCAKAGFKKHPDPVRRLEKKAAMNMVLPIKTLYRLVIPAILPRPRGQYIGLLSGMQKKDGINARQSAYKQAGVDIDAGAALVERIKPGVKRTIRPGVMGGLGGFGALFDLKQTPYKDPILVSSTDGVGTKLKIAIDTGLIDTVGIDLVAMCVNDLVTSGAEPLFFLDYFASGQLDVEAAQRVIDGIAEGCRLSGCALVGGETAEMPGMYAKGDFDLAGFSVGAVERDRMVDGTTVQEGDVVLGLASSGLHSNGFSLVRAVVADAGYHYTDEAPFAPGRTLAEVLLTPTKLYVKSILHALGKGPAIRAMANITGGGLPENAHRMLPDGLGLSLDAACWTLPPVFRWLAQTGGIPQDDLAVSLNCGIGMVVMCRETDADQLADILQGAGETVMPIGTVTRWDGLAPRVQIHNRAGRWPG
jgi:phosphoribosylformylglycinamidine cyclo-ligase